MQMYTLTDSDMTSNANKIRELFTKELLSAGEITEEQFDKIICNYVVVTTRKGWLGEIWDKVRGISSEGPSFVVLKNPTTYSDKK